MGTRQAYLQQLQTNPLRTKMLTSGSLSGLQEVLASWIAKDVGPSGHYVNSRVPKMAVYGAFISAPLGHFLISILQRMFSGRTSLTAKIMQILVSNLVVRLHYPRSLCLERGAELMLGNLQVAPIQNTVYLASMAVIAGARTFHQIRATIRAGFMPVMKVSWVVSPLALAFAQKFLPEQTWVPFFNIVAFVIGTWINSQTKKKRLQALRRKVGRFYISVTTMADGISSTMVTMDEAMDEAMEEAMDEAMDAASQAEPTIRDLDTSNFMNGWCI